MSSRPVAAFFTFIEVPPGAHRAYNEYHQLDHLPEQYRIPGIVYGQRWVATPQCVAARAVAGDDVMRRSQYLAVYLIAEPVQETLADMNQLARDLWGAGRSFEQRQTHALPGWRITGAAVAPRVRVSAEVLPWRPATGVHLIAQPTDAVPLDAGALVEIDGVAGCWTFERDATDQAGGWGTAGYRFTMAWLDGDPPGSGARIGDGGAEKPVLSATYETITAGSWGWFDR